MPSPFPGMDPYLEHPERWPGIHLGLIVELEAQLNRTLPERMCVARIATRAQVAGDDSLDACSPKVFDAAGNEELAEIVLNVVDLRSREIVTVIDILYLADKDPRSSRYQAYERDRITILSMYNLVEIDLLRDGERSLIGRMPDPAADYIVRMKVKHLRYQGRGRFWTFWPMGIREHLPRIPIPLHHYDSYVVVDLQKVLDDTYDRHHYDIDTDYRCEPVPPLSPDLAVWSDRLLKSKGFR